MIAVWCLILASAAWCGAIRLLLLVFGVPALLAGNMQSLRKYIEHLGLTGSTPLGSTRSVVPRGPIGRLVAFTLFDIPYHGVHHRFAGMPHAKMPEFTSVLTTTRRDEPPPYPTYRSALWDMLRSLPDPRVGAQWNRSRSAKHEAQPFHEMPRAAA
jgi:fatty acid desaturase